MNILIRWKPPVELTKSQGSHYTYTCEDFDEIPNISGIYVFARQFGESVSPLYVGKAKKLCDRIKKQFNNHYLMKGIEHAPNGKRIVLIGEMLAKPGQQLKTALNLVESQQERAG